jgi:hypothetical protein
MEIHRDGNDQPFIAWEQCPGAYKRAWIRKTAAPETDYAGIGRYINVARTDQLGSGPAGQSADFPIFDKNLSDEQILIAFVAATCAITGCAIP